MDIQGQLPAALCALHNFILANEGDMDDRHDAITKSITSADLQLEFQMKKMKITLVMAMAMVTRLNNTSYSYYVYYVSPALNKLLPIP
jgi:hypothetical protein